MKIKKTYQGSLPDNKIVNTESNSQTDTYSCDYLNPSFAQMHTNAKMEVADDSTTVVNVWQTSGNIEVGDFYCDPTNNRVVVPAGSAEYVEIFGNITGSGNVYGYLFLEDSSGSNTSAVFLFQFGTYFATPLPNRIIKLDTTKDYYLKLEVEGYNGKSFYLNNGFGNSHTFIGVKKIK